MQNSKLGCTTCKKVGSLCPEKTGGMKLAKEWVECTVTSSASDVKKNNKEPSEKKVFEHARTKAHLAAASIVAKAKDDTLTQVIVTLSGYIVFVTFFLMRSGTSKPPRKTPPLALTMCSGTSRFTN